MIDWSKRAHTPELMDGPCSYEEFQACLHDLARVNIRTRAYGPSLQFLARLKPLGRPLRIVDVGSGYGDMLRRIAQWAAHKEIDVELIGVDLNPYAAQAAREVTAAERGIRWITANAFDYKPEGGIDVVISSLFTHHLTDDEIVQFLQWMDRTAQIGWFVSDLHRHPLPYAVFRIWSKLAGWHRFVQNDGPISITRAFVKKDWKRLIKQAGLRGTKIRWHMPFRWGVGRVK
jgi:SAM-dependent methyltransferase